MSTPTAIPRATTRANAGSLAHYWDVYTVLWRNSVVREMSFKSNFILWIFVEILWFALQLCFVAVIYQHTQSIGSWSKWQVVILMGTSQVIQQLFTAIFFTNCTQLSEHIRTGKLDFLLLLPMNTRFLVSLRTVDLGGFINAAAALAVVGYGVVQLGLRPSFGQIIIFLALIACGLLLHYSLMLMLASTSFFTVRAQGIIWGYYNLFSLSRWPDEAFRGLFRGIFTFVLPMLLVANVPARVLAGTLSSTGTLWICMGLTVLFLLLSEIVWRFSLRHYTSASS